MKPSSSVCWPLEPVNAPSTVSVRFGSQLGSALSIISAQCVMISHDVFIYGKNNQRLQERAGHELVGSRLRAEFNSWQNSVKGPIVIEDDVWIGCNVIVLKGVTIGTRAVIGAGAVVTRNIPASTVAAGIPCRVVGLIENDLDQS